jgi:hypothetical protein
VVRDAASTIEGAKMGSRFDRAAVSIPALIVSSTLTALDVTEQKDQPFRGCRVSENRIATS